MAGSDPNFSPAFFRSAIKSAMNMGVPEDESLRLTWHFNPTVVYEVEDPAENPYDWTDTPTTNTPDPDAPTGTAIVDYALEFAAKGTTGTTVGEFDTSRAVVTMLDVDYEQIQSADFAMVGDTRYEIDFSAPPMGMFEVTVFQVYLTAADT